MSSLQDLVYRNQLAKLRIVLAQGYDPNQTEDYAEITALHVAVQMKRLVAIKLLLCAGANIHPQDIDGITPIQLAHQQNQMDIVLMLTTCVADTFKQLN